MPRSSSADHFDHHARNHVARTIADHLDTISAADIEGKDNVWNAVFANVVGLRLCYEDGCAHVGYLNWHPLDTIIPLNDANAATMVSTIFENGYPIRPHRAYPSFNGMVDLGDGKAFGLFAVSMLQCASASTETSASLELGWQTIASSSNSWGESTDGRSDNGGGEGRPADALLF